MDRQIEYKDEGWLLSPKIIPNDQTVLSFDIALTTYRDYAPFYFDEDDAFIIHISQDCGYTYQPIYAYDINNPISHKGTKRHHFIGRL